MRCLKDMSGSKQCVIEVKELNTFHFLFCTQNTTEREVTTEEKKNGNICANSCKRESEWMNKATLYSALIKAKMGRHFVNARFRTIYIQLHNSIRPTCTPF